MDTFDLPKGSSIFACKRAGKLHFCGFLKPVVRMRCTCQLLTIYDLESINYLNEIQKNTKFERLLIILACSFAVLLFFPYNVSWIKSITLKVHSFCGYNTKACVFGRRTMVSSSAIQTAQQTFPGSVGGPSIAAPALSTHGPLSKPSGISQEELDKIARDVQITVEVIDNLKHSNRSSFGHGVKIELHNRAQILVPSSGWKLFFQNLFLLFPSIFPKSKSTVLDIEKLRISMHGGTLYSMEPVNGFKAIHTNETRVIELDSSFWSVAETDFMPYWYFVSTKEGTIPRIAQSTEDMSLRFVKPFKDVRQWKRYIYDRYNPFTPQERMRRLQVNDTGRIEKPVIPTPLYINIKQHGPTVLVDQTWKIYYDEVSKSAADYLADKLSLPESLTTDFPVRSEVVYLHVVPKLKIGPEGYSLRIEPYIKVIEIMSEYEAGIFYGVQTLLSLMKTFPEGLPHTDVHDKPRYGYRGMLIDVARHFVPSNELMRLMDVMAMYKLNKLHIHLANDEGVRLHIPDLPELTQVGADRCHDLTEQKCIIPQLGTGPFEIVRRGRYGWSHEYYQPADYKALLEYAKGLHIEVIPEFDMPAHSHAAIKSMEARYNKYKLSNATKAEEYRLIDPNDTSEYISLQWWTDNVMNPCIESTYRFVAKVVDTLIDLHKDIQPLKVFHFGGDEAPKGALVNSTQCQKFMAENHKYSSVEDLKQYFVERVAKITADRGLGIRSWADAVIDKEKPGGQPIPLADLGNTDVSANDWHDVWEWGPSPAYKLAKADYKVILSHASYLYFDHPQEPDPKERGLYWATRFVDTRKTFGYLPDSIYDNINVKLSGEPQTRYDICGANMSKCDPLVKKENIIGIQGQLWTEVVRTYKEFEHMIYPRLLALAERAWHKADFETYGLSAEKRKHLEGIEWEKFANTLGYKELKRLDEAFDDIKNGVFYRVPPPGARVTNGKVEVSVTYPGLIVEYSKDGGNTWNEVTPGSDVLWDKGLKVMHLRTRSASGDRYSRVVELYEDEPPTWTDQSTIDYIAENLKITAGVVDNLNKVEGKYATLVLKLHNLGEEVIPRGTWKLYFHNLYGLKEEELDCGLFLEHVTGDLYSLTFVNDPEPGQGVTCTLYQESWNVAKSDFFPNWYVSSVGMVPKIVENTKDTLDYVLPYDTPEKWKRSKEDMYNPFTPEERFAFYNVKGRRRIHIIPTPLYTSADENDRKYIRLSGWAIHQSPKYDKEATFLAETLQLPITLETRAKYISFHEAPWSGMSQAAYHLIIKPNSIIIKARGPAGAFYAVQSLISMWESGGGRVPVMEIRDTPRFDYRGVMIDVARNFKPKEWLYKVLDIMALYKLNVLHLHLTDNEGWRLEIPGIPELTEMGANRCHNQDRELCLLPQRGSGPAKSFPGSGFYTVQDYRDILQYAAKRHITVIPEIDMPGHSRAAIEAMKYRKLKIENLRSRGADVSEMKTYDLQEPLDKLAVKNADSMMNPCVPSVYEFINKVIDELVIMHNGIMDLEIFNMGGNDKIPDDIWTNSPACKRNYHAVDTLTLRKIFVNMVADIVAAKRMDLMAWEDIFYDVDKPIPITEFRERNLFTIVWKNKWEDGQAKRLAQFADAGYKVILGSATHLFFDVPCEPDPEDLGLYWASRSTNTMNVFGFMPDDLFLNAEVTSMGQPINLMELCQNSGCPNVSKPENIIGMEGILFSDVIRTEKELQIALFPRLLALAERAWHRAPWELVTDKKERTMRLMNDWNMFSSALGYNEFPRLEKRHIHIRLPPPGARLVRDTLYVRSFSPNLQVQLSINDGVRWYNVYNRIHLRRKRYKILLRARSKVSGRTSKIVSLVKEKTKPNGLPDDIVQFGSIQLRNNTETEQGVRPRFPVFKWWHQST